MSRLLILAAVFCICSVASATTLTLTAAIHNGDDDDPNTFALDMYYSITDGTVAGADLIIHNPPDTLVYDDIGIGVDCWSEYYYEP